MDFIRSNRILLLFLLAALCLVLFSIKYFSEELSYKWNELVCEFKAPHGIAAGTSPELGAEAPSMEALPEGRWVNLAVAAYGWPESAKIRSVRGLVLTEDGNILVGPRTDHGECGARFGLALRFDRQAWRIIGGTEDSYAWPDPRIDRINQITKIGKLAYFALGAQYKEVGAASVVSYDGGAWDVVGFDGVFGDFSAAMTVAAYDGGIAAGLVAPGVAGPAIVARRAGDWRDITPAAWRRCSLSFVFDLVEFRGDLFAATVDAGESCIAGIWRYDGATWTHVAGADGMGPWAYKAEGEGMVGVNDLEVAGDILYAALTKKKGSALFPAYRYDGAAWEPIGGDSAPEALYKPGTYFDFVQPDAGRVLLGGSESAAFDGPPLWVFDGSQWAGFPRDGMEDIKGSPQSAQFFYDIDVNPTFIVGVLGSGEPGGGDVWIYRRPKNPAEAHNRP